MKTEHGVGTKALIANLRVLAASTRNSVPYKAATMLEHALRSLQDIEELSDNANYTAQEVRTQSRRIARGAILYINMHSN